MKNLNIMVKGLEAILNNEEVLKSVMKDELRKVKKEYAVARKTDIKDEITELKIDTEVMIPKEDVIVSITKDGYVKRTSLRSYSSSTDTVVNIKEGDYTIGFYEMNTLNTLLLFTNLGNYLYVPVHTIPTCAWKDLGKHISNLVKLEEGELIVSSIPVIDFDSKLDITIATKNGMIKRTKLDEFKSSRYTKPISCMKLKDKDEVITAFLSTYNDIFITTNKLYGLWFDINDIPVIGLKASGVKSINLKSDTVVSVTNFNQNIHEYITIVTDKGTAKRVKISEFEKTSRAKRGLLVLREVKTNPYRVIKSFINDSKDYLGIKTTEIITLKLTEIPIMDRYSTGSQISKKEIIDAFINQELIKLKDQEPTPKIEEKKETKKVSLKEIDDRLMTIDDFNKILTIYMKL